MDEDRKTEAYPICQGDGTRGYMAGDCLVVRDCDICGGSGRLPVFDAAEFEAAKDRRMWNG